MDNEIIAAGGVIIEESDGKRRALLVHRPRYDDWSFPKGKLDAGETIEEAAVREVEEETGLKCRIETKLAVIRYRTRGKGERRPKAVHYFSMERVGGGNFEPGDEVDRAEWFDFDEAIRTLSYSQDREMLALIDD